MAQAATTQSVKGIRRDIPFTWEGRDKKGNKVKGKSVGTLTVRVGAWFARRFASTPGVARIPIGGVPQ